MVGWGSETYIALFKFSLSMFYFHGAETAVHVVFVCIFSSRSRLHLRFQCLLIISLGQATVYLVSGLYGQPSDLGTSVCLLLIIQLIVAALIIILLHKLLQKDYGLGSATNVFIATSICECIV